MNFEETQTFSPQQAVISRTNEEAVSGICIPGLGHRNCNREWSSGCWYFPAGVTFLKNVCLWAHCWHKIQPPNHAEQDKTGSCYIPPLLIRDSIFQNVESYAVSVVIRYLSFLLDIHFLWGQGWVHISLCYTASAVPGTSWLCTEGVWKKENPEIGMSVWWKLPSKGSNLMLQSLQLHMAIPCYLVTLTGKTRTMTRKARREIPL